MASFVVLILYLADELLSSRLPLSSGAFALALIAVYFGRAALKATFNGRALALVAAALSSGLIGASLSGTPLSPLFVATVLMLFLLWATGAGLQGPRGELIEPRMALIGVAVSTAFLVLSLLGWDAMSVVSGIPSNRGVGLYLEPSHYALYVMPLWLIAFQRRAHRPWLYGALVLVIMTSFSASLAAFLVAAFVLHALSRSHRGPSGSRPQKASAKLAVAASTLTLLAVLPVPIEVNGVSIQSYVGSRLDGLRASEDSSVYNISSLVVLQGIELAYLSFTQSLGFGVGLGNLGTSNQILDQSVYKEIINTITAGRLDLSLRDGGLLANKLVGELGWLTLPLSIFLVSYFIRVRSGLPPRSASYHLAFAAALICLLFVRALPYFSAPTCLGILSMCTLLPLRGVSRSQRAGTKPRGSSYADPAKLQVQLATQATPSKDQL